MKWLWVCASVATCIPLLGQVPDASIDIDGVKIRHGITLSEAQSLFKTVGHQLLRLSPSLFSVEVPGLPPKEMASEVARSPQLLEMYGRTVGRLHLENENVVGACRWWNLAGEGQLAPNGQPQSAPSSELARVLMAAIGPAATQASQSAAVGVRVDNNPQDTVETLTIHIGQRTINVIRDENHRPIGSSSVIIARLVDVEECL